MLNDFSLVDRITNSDIRALVVQRFTQILSGETYDCVPPAQVEQKSLIK